MKVLTLIEVELICLRLAKKFYDFDEPIPAFKTRFPHVLESSLAVPFQQFNKEDAYKGLINKAAILFYLLVKNHPFQNGNKRIAMTCLFVFLYKNKKWLRVDEKELYNFALWVAQSPAKLKNEVVLGIKKFLEVYLLKI